MEIYKTFSRVGKILHTEGLISATAGNLSIRQNGCIHITASGSILGDLQIGDVVRVSLDEKPQFFNPNIFSKDPSIEIEVHKKIYYGTEHNAIVHAHTPTAIALTYEADRLELIDSEGMFYLPYVPVVSVKNAIASEEVAQILPSLLTQVPAVIVRGHGTFAASDTLIKACGLISTIEFSSKIIHLRNTSR